MFLREEKEEEQDSGRDDPQWGKPPPAHVLKQLPGWHESQN